MTGTRLRQHYGAMGIMLIVALLPYVCRGTMSMPDTTAAVLHHAAPQSDHGAPQSSRVASDSPTLATAPHGGAHCAKYDCCSTPSRQETRFRTELPAIAVQAAVSPAAPRAAVSALVQARGASPNAAAPGIQAPLIL